MEVAGVIARCREAGLEISLGLRVRPWSKVPAQLRQELQEHRDELVAALVGKTAAEPVEASLPSPAQVQVALADIRPYLRPAFQQLSDHKLLALVNWHVMKAWEKARDSIETG